MNENIADIIRQSLEILELHQEDPRLLVLGATGTGKSSLINAVTGGRTCVVTDVASTTRVFQPQRYVLPDGDALVVVDSPGYGEAGTDREYRASLAREAGEAHALLVVLKADEKGYQRDLEVLARVVQDPAFGPDRPVLVALNQVDKLKPSREWQPPYETTGPVTPSDTPKQRNLKEKLELVREQLSEALGERPFALVPTMADPEEGVLFGIDHLKVALFDAMPEAVRYRFARMVDLAATRSAELLARLDDEAEEICRGGAAEAAAVVALNPLPLSDFLVLTPIQIRMVARIGAVYGRRLDEESVLELLATIGAGLGARSVFQGLLSFIPGVKQFVGAPFASAATYGLGCAARAYFKSGAVPGFDQLRVIVQSRIDGSSLPPVLPEG